METIFCFYPITFIPERSLVIEGLFCHCFGGTDALFTTSALLFLRMKEND